MHFVYIVTYLGKILVIEWEISSLINDYFVVCIKKDVTDSINNETIIQQIFFFFVVGETYYTAISNMKNSQKKIVEGNCKTLCI